MIHSSPGVRSHNYISYVQSPWHIWFQELGYPQLDINRFPDGEWSVIEYYNAPIIPAETRWCTVLSGMRNIEISVGFIEKYVLDLDSTKKAVWEREEKKTQAVLAEAAAREQHAERMAEAAKQAIVRNPDLMERIAENGLQEMDLTRIARHIPRHRL
jgi:hypothetical protein